MGRQSIRQQAESNVPRRSAAPPRSQTRLETVSTENTSRPIADPAAPTIRSPRPRSQPKPQKAPQKSSQTRSPRPWFLLVFLMWGISLAIAMMATRSLLDPTVASSSGIPSGIPPAEKPASEETLPPDPAPPVALDESYFYQAAEDNHLPIVALGSTAISCAMSCLLVARALQPRRSPPQLKSRSKKRTALKSTSVQSPQLSDAKASAAPSVPAKPPFALPAAIEQSSPEKSETAESAIVSVMSSGQSIPLDWEEPSLADSLDLRQRRVLPF